jgi:nitroimidazol reductase NimA-like FMN-containing flavoprotein (pyridoxamine 5'-phosphate oxidase superfamily)
VAQRAIEILSTEECWELLRGDEVGRLVYTDALGPVAVPVNYAIVPGGIAFRVEGGVKRQAISQPGLAFEVDHLDHEQRSGWSVIARGPGRELGIEEAAGMVSAMTPGPPSPWAGGVHNVWLLIEPVTLTGRWLRDEATPLVF